MKNTIASTQHPILIPAYYLNLLYWVNPSIPSAIEPQINPYSLYSNDRLRGVSISIYAKLLQSCLTLCDPMDCSPPVSSVHGVLQARILEWIAISFSRGSSQPRDRTHISHVSCICRWVPSSTTREAPISVWLCPNPGLTNSLLRDPSFLVKYQWTEGGKKKICRAFQPVLWDL